MKKIIPFLLAFCCFSTCLFSQDNVLNFDGINDYIQSSTAINGSSGTWEAWVQKVNWADHHDDRLFGNGINFTSSNSFYISLNASGYHFRYGGTGQVGNVEVHNASTQGFAANSWHHLAATWNRVASTTTIAIYIDGVASGTTTTSLLLALSGNSYIGGDATNPKFGAGNLDDIAIWSNAKTASEISLSVGKLISYPQTNLTGFMNFNTSIASGNNTVLNSLPDLITPSNMYTLNNFALNGATSNFIASNRIMISGVSTENPQTIANNVQYAEYGSQVTITGKNLLGVTISNIKIGSFTPFTSIISNNGNQLIAVLGSTQVGGSIKITSATVGIAQSIITVISKAQNVLNFDGVNDYLSRTDSSINPVSGTWEAWVQKANWADHHDDRLLGNGIDFTDNNSFYISLHPSVGFHLRYGGTSQAGNNAVYTNVTQGFAANSWHHLAASWNFDGTNTTLKIYVDGVLASTAIANLLITTSSPTYFGGDNANPKFGAGNIDDIRLWDHVRADAEIAENFSKQTTYPQSGLTFFQNFNTGIADGDNTLYINSANGLGSQVNNYEILHPINFTMNGASSNIISSSKTMIYSISNTSGVAGSTLTITGINLTGATTSSVKIGGTSVSSIVSNNGTTLVVTVGSGTSGKVTVNTPTGGIATSKETFTFTDINNALHFDGVNDYVQFSGFTGRFGTGDFTVESWFKTNSASQQGFIAKRSTCGNQNFWNLTTISGTVTFEIGPNYSAITTGSVAPVGQWNHVAVTRSGTALKLYVNGVLAASGSATLSNINDSTVNLYFGRNICTYFNGLLDEVRFWNVARSAAEIASNYNKIIDLPQTGLTNYWNFNTGIPGGNNTASGFISDMTNGAINSVSNFTLNGTASNFVQSDIGGMASITGVNTITNNGLTHSSCIGSSITIYGSNLNHVNAVSIGNIPVASFVSNTATQLVVTCNTACSGKVSVTTLSGTTVSQDIVTVNELPNVTATSTANTVCQGSTITLNGGGASSYAWSGGVNDNTPFTINASNVYTVVGTDANSCSATSTVSITMNPNPTASIGASDTFICPNSSVLLSASNVVLTNTYTWTDGIVIMNGSTTSYSPATTTSYTLSVTDTNACSSTAAVTVIVGSVPDCYYCEPAYSTPYVMYSSIIAVEIPGTTFLNYSGTSYATSAYKMYTPPAYTASNYTANLEAGQSYTLVVTDNNLNSDGYAAWIDFNDDHAFSIAEKIGYLDIVYLGSTGYLTFKIPCNANPGSHRLRIRNATYVQGSNLEPCSYVSLWGETEDYVVNIVAPAAGCVAPSSFGIANGGLTVSGATLDWIATCNDMYWQLEYGAVGFTPGTGTQVSTTTHPYTLNTPTCGPSYDIFVRGYCGNGYSSYIGPLTITPPCYCIPSYTNGTYFGDEISQVQITGTTLNNSSVFNPSSPMYVAYLPPTYTAPNYTAQLERGHNYNCIVTTGVSSFQVMRVWIDYNDDGVFAPNESLGESAPQSNTSYYSVSFPFTISNTAKLGNHRMRVRDVYYSFGIDPCANYSFGETEDYLVQIICSPNQSSVSATACDTYTWPLNQQTYTSSGAYHDTVLTSTGCDSIITLNLSIHSSSHSSVQISACNTTGYTWLATGVTYTLSGTYYHTATTANGCAITDTLILNIIPAAQNQSMSIVQQDLGCSGKIAEISLTASEPDVAYTLVNTSNNNPLASPKIGTGSSITFTTDTLHSNTSLGISASKIKSGLRFNYGSPSYLRTNATINSTSGTWESWVSKDDWTTVYDEPLFSDEIPDYLSNSFYISLHPAVGLHFRYGGGPDVGNAYVATNSIFGFAASSWHHLAASWNTSNGVTTIKLFVDGNEMASNTSSATLSMPSNIVMNVFYGRMDEIRLWNYARSESEIQTAMSDCNLMTASGLIGNWNLNDGPGNNIAQDISGYNHPANLNGISPISDWVAGAIPCGSCNNMLSQTFTVEPVPCNTQMDVAFYIQGFYQPYWFMLPVLYNQGVETNPATNNVDSATIELREDDATHSYPLVGSFTGLLQKYGNLYCTYPDSVSGKSCYIVIKHRNSIETWSAVPITIDTTNTYDFRFAANAAYGDNQILIDLIPVPRYALYSGDINKDENVDLLDATLLENDINNFEFGYFATDINGDGNVDLLDSPSLETNINSFIYSAHP